jgi:selenocysteine-specific elongation factor
MIVAIAGHVDHGKTSLVKALTGINTDRLPEEKHRGMSIDFGVAYWSPEGNPIGFVDVPGHIRYIRNMLSGTYAIEHLLLVIAADDGIMPQTREHLRIANLLGIDRGTIVLTKVDRVDSARIDRVKQDAKRLLEDSDSPSMPIFTVSSATGDGLDALKAYLIELTAEPGERRRTEEFARFVVDRAFVVPGSGTVVTGTVIAGQIRAGDNLVALPVGTRVRARKLEAAGQEAKAVRAGERCAINLPNIAHESIGRGSWIVAPEADLGTERIEVAITVPADAKESLRHWTPVHLHIGSADVTGRVVLRRGEPILPGQQGYAELRLQRPIHALHGDRFILRDQSALQTIGGGRVLDPTGPAGRASHRNSVRVALDTADPERATAGLLSLDAPLRLEWLARILNRPLSAIRQLVPDDATVVKAGAHFAFSGEMVRQLKENVVEAVRRFHRDNPGSVGMDMSVLQRKTAPRLDPDVFAALVRHFASSWDLLVQSTQIRLASHDPTANIRDIQIWSRLLFLMEKQGFAIPSVRELSVASNLPAEKLRDLFFRKSANGAAVKITPERFTIASTFRKLVLEAVDLARQHENGMFTAADFRDRIGTGRTLAIEILECMDRQGVTIRRGNVRVINAHYAPSDNRG